MGTPLGGLTEDEAALFHLVPPDGTTRTNPSLRNELGWEAERYFAVRNSLVDKGWVRLWRGRGGTVMRVLEDVAPAAPTQLERQREEELYKPLKHQLGDGWARANRLEPIVVEITARSGRKATGIWSRPDVVMVEVHRLEFPQRSVIEIITFEVKPPDYLDVRVVYEALSHSRAATRSYAVLHIPEDMRGVLKAKTEAIIDAAQMHGIGVIVVENPDDYETWEEVVPPRREHPDPSLLDRFIREQLSQDAKDKISRRLRPNGAAGHGA